jgi:thiol-disulfide isomerase/thioredoxin
MKKILFTLACAAMVCACDARHNAKANNPETTTTAANDEDTDAMMAPDFTLEDIYGMPLTLSSFRGTYVVLDFWGSWCPWCIKGIPEMKKYYKKYSGKFEIIGIDCNDPVDKWKAAVANYDMPWKHVYNPKGSRLAQQYGIQGYPTKIIIDPKGRIDKVVVGEDPVFYEYLDELFK